MVSADQETEKPGKARLLRDAAVIVVITLVLLEVAMQVANMAPPLAQVDRSILKLSDNKILLFENNPTHMYINRDGFVGPQVTRDKPDGTFRIAVLGDSVAFGYGVSAHENFPAVLRGLLADSQQQKIEVINAGVDGYNTRQEAELFRVKVRPFAPDLVILQVCFNDYLPSNTDNFSDLLANNTPEAQAEREFLTRQGPLARLIRKSRVYQHARYLLAWLRLTSREDEDKESENVEASKLAQVDWESSPVVPEGMAMLSENRGDANVIAVIFPAFGESDFENKKYPDYRRHQQEATARMAMEQGFEVIDLTECYEIAYDRDQQRFDSDGIHPTAYGHEVAARCIAESLRGRIGE